MGIVDRERFAKLQAVEQNLRDLLYIAGGKKFADSNEKFVQNIADCIMRDIEFVEVEFEVRHYEARLSNAD